MFIEQIIEFQLRGLEPPGRTYGLQLVLSMTKQKSSRKIFEWNITVFAAKTRGGVLEDVLEDRF